MENKDYLLAYSSGYPNAKQEHQQYQYEGCSLKILCLMQTSESKEGSSAYESLTTNTRTITSLVIYRKKSKTIKQ